MISNNYTSVPSSVDLTPFGEVSQISTGCEFASTSVAGISPEQPSPEITLYQQSQLTEEEAEVVVKVK